MGDEETRVPAKIKAGKIKIILIPLSTFWREDSMNSFVDLFYVEAAQHLWTRLQCLTRGSSPA
jgi:hypothetical protein